MSKFATPDDEKNLTEAESREWMCEVGRRMWTREMVEANGGNLSIRLGDNRFLATPTNISKGFMSTDDLVILDREGSLLEGKRKPTSEIKLHMAIYRERPDIKAVVHAHPRHATAFAAVRKAPPACILPEIELFVGEVGLSPYVVPGSHEFAESIVPFVKKHCAIILASHGAVTFGAGIMDAYWKMEILDSYCATLLLARQVGQPVEFTHEQMRQLFETKKSLGIEDYRI